MNRTALASSLSALMISSQVMAVEVYKDSEISAEFGGYFETNITQSNGDTDMTDSNSRINLGYEHKLTDGWTAKGFTEWRVNLVSNTDSIGFTAGGDDFTSSPEDFNNTVNVRLGYISLKHDKWGVITAGKQWSVYYDVTAWTDTMFVWGGNASGTYTYGTDGGQSGTGRAEKALTYRNSFGDFNIGLQYQAKSSGRAHIYECQIDPELNCTPDNIGDKVRSIKFDYGAGASLVYNAPFNLDVGVSYNRSKLNDTIGVSGFNDDYEDVIAVGLAYGQYSDSFYIASNYNWGTNHEFDDAGTVFDSEGLEIYTHYMPTSKIRLFAGFNNLKVAGDDADYDGNFELKYYSLGVQYLWTEKFIPYFESRLDDTTFTNDYDPDNIFALGMRLYW